MSFNRTKDVSQTKPVAGSAPQGEKEAGSQDGLLKNLRGVGYAQGAAMLSPRVQARLTASSPGDSLEGQADRVAGRVMDRLSAGQAPADRGAAKIAGASAVPAPASTVNAETSPAATVSASGGAGGMPVGDQQAAQIDAARQSGEALGGGVRSRMEGAFGADFGSVKVHRDSPAADLCDSMGGARALTSGNDIFMGPGQYQPDSHGGQELLAHELTHTLQQGASERVAGWWSDAHEQITRAAGAAYQDRIGKEALDYVATRAGSIDATVRSTTNFAYGIGLKGGERTKYEQLPYDKKQDRFAQKGEQGPTPPPPQVQSETHQGQPQTGMHGPEDVQPTEDQDVQQQEDVQQMGRPKSAREALVQKHGLDLSVHNPKDVPQLRANDTRTKGKDDLGIKWRKLTDSEKKRQMWDNLMFHVRWTRETKFHGEAGQYVNESAESINMLAVDDQTRKAAGLYRGGARREGLLQLSDAVHNAEDRGSHGEGRPYTGHDPRLTMPQKFDGTPNERYVPGWDCDNPAKNAGGRAQAEIYAREVFENFMFQVNAHTGDKIKGTKNDPGKQLKEGQGGIGKSKALRTGVTHALRFGIEKVGKAIPKHDEDVQSWVRNPEEYEAIKRQHPEGKLSSRPEDNMPSYRQTAGKSVSSLLLRELDEVGAVFGLLTREGKSGKDMEGGFKKLTWLSKHAEELAAIVRQLSGDESSGPKQQALTILADLQGQAADWARLAKGKHYQPNVAFQGFMQQKGLPLRLALTTLFGLEDVQGGLVESVPSQTGTTPDTGPIRVKGADLLAEMKSIVADLGSERIGPAEMEKKLKRYSLLGQWAGGLKSDIDKLPAPQEGKPSDAGERRNAIRLLLGNLEDRSRDWARRASTSGTTRHALRTELRDEIIRDIAMFSGLLSPQLQAVIGLGAKPLGIEGVVPQTAQTETQEGKPPPLPPRPSKQSQLARPLPIKPKLPAPPPPPKPSRPILKDALPEVSVKAQPVVQPEVQQDVQQEVQAPKVPEAQPKEAPDSPRLLMEGARDSAKRLLTAIQRIRNDLRSGLLGAADIERSTGRYTLLAKSAQEALRSFQLLGPGPDTAEGRHHLAALNILVGIINDAQTFAQRANEISLRGHARLKKDVLDYSERIVDSIASGLEQRLVIYTARHVDGGKR